MCILSFKEILQGWSRRNCLKWAIQPDAYSRWERETEHCSDRREHWNANGRLVSAATHLSRCSCTSGGLGSAGVRLAARLTYDWAKLARRPEAQPRRVQPPWNCIKPFLMLSREYTWIYMPVNKQYFRRLRWWLRYQVPLRTREIVSINEFNYCAISAKMYLWRILLKLVAH